jgi:DNA-binding NarL/FixJ family response regulator
MKATNKELDELDRKIITLLGEGKPIKDIAWKLGKHHRQIDYRIKVMRRHFRCANNVQLVLTLQSELSNTSESL